MNAQVDHLVLVARTLEQGVAWCEATLGVTPGAGGKHPLMGTHNRLLPIGSTSPARAYAEIIAIDPGAPMPPQPRWFGLDEARVQAAVREVPQLLHFVVRVPDLAAACAVWAAHGLDAGTPVAATRETPHGMLRWQITVRRDGRPQLHGALPTLIQWGDAHPTDTMPAVGLALAALQVSALDPQPLRRAYAAIGLQQVEVRAGVPALHATLSGPRGLLNLTGTSPWSP